MAQIGKVLSTWTGFSGAPGYTNLFFGLGTAPAWDDTVAQSAVDRVRTFLNTFASDMPQGLSITVSPTVEIIDEFQGGLQALFNAPVAPAAITGQSVATYAAPTGLCVSWTTDGIFRGRRVRGRTFIVPLTSAAFEANGTISTTDLATYRTAADTYRNASTALCEPNVWARPKLIPNVDPVEYEDGAAFVIQASAVTDKAAVLRSRRD